VGAVMRYLAFCGLFMCAVLLMPTLGIDVIRCFTVNADDLSEISLEMALTSGGDERIVISPGYFVTRSFTKVFPTPEVIARSSTTGSTLSEFSFKAAEKLFEELRVAQAAEDFEFFPSTMEGIRRRIGRVWGFGSVQPCHVITSPSGSDAEMLPAVAALVRHDSWRTNKNCNRFLVTNIVIASGEIGAAVIPASGLRHINPLTPRGNFVHRGEPITGVANKVVNVVEFKMRNEDGTLVSDPILEAGITRVLHKAIEQEGHIGVLHMVHACKTGLGVPREAFVKSLKEKYNDRLVVVVDAAQLRMDETVVARWLDNGFWTLLTGSKFLAGPMYSGALLVPHHEVVLLEQAGEDDIPLGLGDYFTQFDCDDIFVNLKKRLSVQHNFGLALRWEAALAEAERFYAIDSVRRDTAIALWSRGARLLIRKAKNLTLLEDVIQGGLGQDAHQSFVGKCNSVVSFGVRVAVKEGSSRYLSMGELRKLQELMLLDLRAVSTGLSPEEERIGAAQALIGQPVSMGLRGQCSAVVRLSMSVPEIYKVIGHEGVDQAVLVGNLLSDDQLLIQKLDLIASRWDYFSQVQMH
jgi:hypothetical protein